MHISLCILKLNSLCCTIIYLFNDKNVDFQYCILYGLVVYVFVSYYRHISLWTINFDIFLARNSDVENLHIALAVWLNHFWRSYCPFSLRIFHHDFCTHISYIFNLNFSKLYILAITIWKFPYYYGSLTALFDLLVLPYHGDLHIVLALWLYHFWRSYCTFWWVE